MQISPNKLHPSHSSEPKPSSQKTCAAGVLAIARGARHRNGERDAGALGLGLRLRHDEPGMQMSPASLIAEPFIRARAKLAEGLRRRSLCHRARRQTCDQRGRRERPAGNIFGKDQPWVVLKKLIRNSISGFEDHFRLYSSKLIIEETRVRG